MLITIHCSGASGATFTFINACSFTVWVGLQPNGGIPLLGRGGFELAAGARNAVTAPTGMGGTILGTNRCDYQTMEILDRLQ